MEHTKEPWIIDEALNQFQIIRRWGNGVAAKNSLTFGSGHGAHIACIDFIDGDAVPTREQAKANADRIVACVNACEGLTNEQLADSVFYGLIQGTILILKMESEKKQILDAATKMARFIRTWEDCLSGVQMSEEDFNEDCGLKEWRRAKASVINGPQS